VVSDVLREAEESVKLDERDGPLLRRKGVIQDEPRRRVVDADSRRQTRGEGLGSFCVLAEAGFLIATSSLLKEKSGLYAVPGVVWIAFRVKPGLLLCPACATSGPRIARASSWRPEQDRVALG
jgi:hypothetical protein